MENSNQAVTTINPDNLKNMGEMLAFGEHIVRSKLSPLKSAQDVVVALLTGRELGIPPMASINNIHPIEGRSSLGIHLILAKLLANGISYKIVRDYEPTFPIVIEKTKKNANNQDEKYFETVREIFLDEKTYTGELRSKSPNNYKTIIEFTRKIKQGDGKWVEMIIRSDFSWNDATNAGYTNKDNYKKNGRIMVRTRALTIGARMIADDLLLGILETSEALDIEKKNYNVDNDGNVTTILTEEIKEQNNNTAENSSTETNSIVAEETEVLSSEVNLNSSEIVSEELNTSTTEIPDQVPNNQ